MIAILLAALLSACRTAPEPAPGPPDIVLVVVDTLRADHLSLDGYARPTSPELDAWAADALVFDRAYAHSGWTLPSFASLLSGQLPHEHRVVRDVERGCFGVLDAQTETLAEALKQRGYRTGGFSNNPYLRPAFGLGQGFDTWDARGATHQEHRSAAETNQDALAWLQSGEGPAFLLVHYMEPHIDYTAPPPFAGTFSQPEGEALLARFGGDQEALLRAWQSGEVPVQEIGAAMTDRYDEEIRTADDAFGALLTALDARERPTVVVFTSDHGEELWDHGGFEHGHSLLSEVTRVPLVIKGPGIPTGRRSDLVGHLELHRTLRSLGGAPSTGHALLDAPLAADQQRVVSDDALYGPRRWSVVSPTHRLEVMPDYGVADLRPVLPDGRDGDSLSGPEHAAAFQALSAFGQTARGTGGPITTREDACVAVHDDASLQEQLRLLGYLDEAEPASSGSSSSGSSSSESLGSSSKPPKPSSSSKPSASDPSPSE